MMILPLLLAPILAAADPQTAAEPVMADAGNILYAPSRSLRSATAAAVEGLPAVPVTVRFECIVGADNGAPLRCIPIEGSARPASTSVEFERRYAAWSSASASAPVAVALQRVLFTRVRPTAEPAAPAPPILMLFTDSVGAGDVIKLGASSGTIQTSDVEMDERPDGAVLTAYYPPAALRADIEARVKATCRVMPDRKLFCRDAELISPTSTMTPEMDGDFRNATYQVFDAIRLSPLTKTGDPVVGRDVELRVSFVSPG